MIIAYFFPQKNIDTDLALCYKQVSLDGAVAQLGERLNGIQEVRGSIPRSSTINYKGLDDSSNPFLFIKTPRAGVNAGVKSYPETPKYEKDAEFLRT